jgi:hypothetical protein
MLRPTALCGLLRHFAALFSSHCDQATLSSDATTTSAHRGHNAGYFGIGDRAGCLFITVSGSADHLKSGLVYVPRVLA